jgi:hypothetical protein
MHHGGVGLTEGLVIVMQQYSRQYVVDLMNRLGYRDLADEALRDLPDPVDVDRLAAWCAACASDLASSLAVAVRTAGSADLLLAI